MGGKLVTPGREQSNVEALAGGLVHDFHHAIEVGLVWAQRVVVNKWPLTQSTWFVQAVELREHDGLNYRVALSSSSVEIVAALLPCRRIDQLPGGIPQPEKRTVVIRLQKMTGCIHANPWQRGVSVGGHLLSCW